METTRRRWMQGMGAAAAMLSCRWGIGQQTQPDVVDKDRVHRPLRKLQPDEAVFFNSDHSPVGAHASLVYGMEASGGLNMLDVRRQRGRPLMVQDGILIGVREGASQKAKIMPFCPAIADPALAEWSDATRARRVLRACVDAWDMGYGVSWKHYTPYWKLENLERAHPAEVARFLLPATWMRFVVDNREGRESKTFIFSLLDPSPAKEHTWGDHHGYVVSKQVQMSPKEGEINELNTQHGVALPASAGKLIASRGSKEKIWCGGRSHRDRGGGSAGSAARVHHRSWTLQRSASRELRRGSSLSDKVLLLQSKLSWKQPSRPLRPRNSVPNATRRT